MLTTNLCTWHCFNKCKVIAGRKRPRSRLLYNSTKNYISRAYVNGKKATYLMWHLSETMSPAEQYNFFVVRTMLVNLSRDFKPEVSSAAVRH